MWGKVNLFCDNQDIINYWLTRKDKQIHALKNSFFENVLLLWISKNPLQTPSLDHILLGNLILSNSIILAEDLIRCEKYFETCLIDHCASDIRNKKITGKYLKILVSVSPTPAVHIGSYIFPWFISYIYYLSYVIETYLKVAITMFYFNHSKNSSNDRKHIFNSISTIIFLKKKPV